MCVNEPWGDGFAGSDHLTGRGTRAQVPDGYNAVASDRDVGPESRRACPIKNGSVTYDHVAARSHCDLL
jgi:hypothetical protein